MNCNLSLLRSGQLMLLRIILALFAFPVIGAGITQAEPPRKIVATTGMIADIVRNVSGNRANVKALMGEGVDPHLYKPTRSDIQELSEADIVFYNGLLLEGKMTDALIRVATAGKKVFAVTELISEESLLQPEEFQGHFDPHVWMDPLAWAKAVEVVRDKLIEQDAGGREYYTQSAATYIAQLEQLNTYAVKALETVPQQSRVIVSAHDAFNYFGRRYNYEVVGIQGLSTESEAGVKDIERIVAMLVQRKIKAVFVESTVSDRNIKALIEGAKAQGHPVIIGGKLFSDAMGKPQTYEGTYLGMIDHNVTAITRALGGEADAKGLSGKLSQN